jgi:membrane-bound lytic murein transglycosylase A
VAIVGRCLALPIVGMCALLAGCVSRPPAQEMQQEPARVVPPAEWPILGDDLPTEGLIKALEYSIEYFEDVPQDTVFRFGPEERTASEMASGVRRMRDLVRAEPDPARLTDLVKREFILLESVGRDNRGTVLFTGYYEPVVKAHRQAVPPYEFPVYGIPEDLVSVDPKIFGFASFPRSLVGRVEGRELRPYASRAEIDFGDGLPAPAPVLGYLADPVDVFFLQVQGSGTLVFPDGSKLRAGYAVSNGWEYRSIGKLLLDEGLVSREEMSMQAIRSYLAAHPEDLERVLSYNPSYVFFRPLDDAGGPLGCYGLPVTAGRSIATDRKLFPGPAVAWVTGTMPSIHGGEETFARFVLNQDTGGSIKGPDRVDLFVGTGGEAAEIAGRMQHLGRFYLLLPISS